MTPRRPLTLAAAIAAFALFGAATPASAANEHDAHHAAPAAPAAGEQSAVWAEGTVKKVDKSAGKLTISHGPLAALDMPPMTMVFRAADPAVLDKVKAGDKIRFIADRVGGVFTVRTLELAQ